MCCPTCGECWGGAVLMIGGIAAFIAAQSPRPITHYVCPSGSEDCKDVKLFAHHHGLSHTAYDVLGIGAWALIIGGALLVIVRLIGYWARVKRPA